MVSTAKQAISYLSNTCYSYDKAMVYSFYTTKWHEKLIKINQIYFISFFTLFTILLSLPFAILRTCFSDEAIGYTSDNMIFEIFIAVIFGPAYETILFFYLLFSLKNKYRFNIFWLYIFIPILFGLSHGYSTLYIIDTAVTGVLWTYAYYVSGLRGERPVINVFLIHSSVNILIGVLQSL